MSTEYVRHRTWGTRLNFGNSARIDEALDECPDSLKENGCVDDNGTAQRLGVVVLVNFCEQSKHLSHVASQVPRPHACKHKLHALLLEAFQLQSTMILALNVNNCKRLVDVVANHNRTRRHNILAASLPLLHMKLCHALDGGDLLNFHKVDRPKVLDVNWPSLLHSSTLGLD